ncbi:uncharacterized protein LOC141626535 [Silene latifolia]|uniref:uncharacterized protein LOC141626535 n=1 Tax=Silene latifolia TaxID=37657 RepID=UPI003D77ADA4
MSTASFSRSRTGDRFYNPPARRQQQQQLLKQSQNHHQQEEREVIRKEKLQYQQFNRNQPNHRRQKWPLTAEVKGKAVEQRTELDECVSTATSVSTRTTIATPGVASSSLSNSTNLDRFLEYTTPSVQAQYFSKTSMKGWQTKEDEFRQYFVLGDLWESFKEWSAYGAGVPLLLNGSDSVVQYYVPYLSGIQLYIDPSKPSPKTRRPGEESDESSREPSSNGSSDGEAERGLNSHDVWRPREVAEFNSLQGLRVKSSNGSSSDEGESSSSTGVLIFEYFEHDTPFSREPLADKISLLASRFPELNTYRSCDLSSSSWISVAWYPIYRIPTGPTLQNLDSCFLTFHFLSTPFSGGRHEWQCHFTSSPSKISNCLPLPIFGMACYKFKISMWDQNGGDESPKANSLMQAADEWLRHLNVNHPDYRFFASHNYYWR